MRISVVLLVLLIVGCAEDKNTSYLQQQEISLTAPRVEANATIIDSFITLSAELRLEGAKLFYTNNDSTPTQNTLQYNAPLKIEEAGTYKFKAFHKEWKDSETTILKLYAKGHTPSKIKWMTTAHNSYPGLGDATLINNKKAPLHFRDKHWVAFDSVAKATVYFKDKRFIKSMTVGYLIDTKSWIFPPKDVTIYLSKKDSVSINIDKLATQNDVKTLEDITIPINKAVDSLSIAINNTKQLPEWHPGKGLKAWLFMDEWIFN